MINGDDNTELDLEEIELEGVNRMNVAIGSSRWWALVNTIMKHHVP